MSVRSSRQLNKKLELISRLLPFFFWVLAIKNIVLGVYPNFMDVSFKQK